MALNLQQHPKYSNTSSFAFPCICLSFTLLSIIFLSFFFLFFIADKQQLPYNQFLQITNSNSVKVYVADIPRSYNYDLINLYWSSTSPDSRLPSDPDHQIRHPPVKYPPYPVNPLINHYSAEYWIMGDLETPEVMRSNSFAKRVFNAEETDVVFVPFFATLSAEMELAKGKNTFKKKGQWLGRGLVAKITSLCSLLIIEALFSRPSCNVACQIPTSPCYSASGRFWWLVQT